MAAIGDLGINALRISHNRHALSDRTSYPPGISAVAGNQNSIIPGVARNLRGNCLATLSLRW